MLLLALLGACGPAGSNGGETDSRDTSGSSTAARSGGGERPHDDSSTDGPSRESERESVERVSNERVSNERESNEPTLESGTSRTTASDNDSERVGASPEGSAMVEVARPTTTLAPARAGRISMTEVRRVIDAHRGEITACYEEGLDRDQNLEGQAAVRFLVGPDGRVEDAEVYQSTLNDPRVEACIATSMRNWEFPRPRPRGRSVLLTYPYNLSTQ